MSTTIRQTMTAASLGTLRHLLVVLALAQAASPTSAARPPLQYESQHIDVAGKMRTVHLPAGYRLEVLTTDLDAPRMVTFGDNGDLFVGSRSGKIYRLEPPYTRPDVLIELDGYPHSVAFRPNEILVAQTAGLYRADYRPGQARLERDRLSLLASIPGGAGHSSRTVRVGPDQRVYLSLGISGNCSDQYLDESYPFTARRGGIMRLREDGATPQWEAYATGLRNPIGFDWHPTSAQMYASNNGPDHHGFDLPPEYFSRVEADSFHGMPWLQYDGARLVRDDCIAGEPPRPAADVTLPVATFPARNAPMAVAFVTPGVLTAAIGADAVVALRGSWATRPWGTAGGDPATRRPPKLVLVRFEDGQASHVEDFVSGFQLASGERWARPVGVAIGPDGALYFTSDSGTSALFRVHP